MAKKLYYKIGEACKSLDIQPYVLRYWETEFSALKPNKSKSGQRVYSEDDLLVIRRIKELLYDEGYTIAGAKKKIQTEDLSKLEPPPKPAPKKRPESKKRPAAKKKTAASAKRKPPAKKPAAKPAKSKAPAVEAGLDAGTRTAIESALAQARGILDLLDKPQS